MRAVDVDADAHVGVAVDEALLVVIDVLHRAAADHEIDHVAGQVGLELDRRCQLVADVALAVDRRAEDVVVEDRLRREGREEHVGAGADAVGQEDAPVAFGHRQRPVHLVLVPVAQHLARCERS